MPDAPARPIHRLRRSWPLVVLALCLCGPARAAQDAPAVTVRGADGLLAENVAAALDVAAEDCALSPARQRILERTLRETAADAARAVGHYEASFDLTFKRRSDCWTLVVEVTPGPPVHLVEVQVALRGPGADDPELRRARRENMPQIGEVLRHDHYRNLRDRLQETAERLGYFDYVLARRELRVDTLTREARIVLELDTGERYRFGTVTLEQDVLHDERVRPWLSFAPGEPWDSERLLASQQALLGSGYFATVQIERGEADPATREIPLTMHLTPRRRWAWLAGVGVSTDTGPRVRLGGENRYINRRGHRWQAQTEVSEVRSNLTTSYEIPLADPVRDRLIFAGGYENEVTDTLDVDQTRIGVRHVTELPSRWVLTRALEFERETFEIADTHRTTELVMPGLQVQRIEADHLVYPRRGWKLGASVRGSHPSISSTDAFIQTQLWGALVLPAARGRVLGRLHAGYTDVADVDVLPATVRFLAGGDSSVRGFDYQSLGPRNADGDIIGGRHLLVGALELDWPLTGPWHGAVFTDAGNAFNDFGDLEVRRSAGVGLRWRSPLGPIRVDFARALDDGREWRFHLSMGPDL